MDNNSETVHAEQTEENSIEDPDLDASLDNQINDDSKSVSSQKMISRENSLSQKGNQAKLPAVNLQPKAKIQTALQKKKRI